MSYQAIPKSAWQGVCDSLSKVLEGRPVEIAVVGLDLGDQIEAERLSLVGVTYDPGDDALYIDLEQEPFEAGADKVHIEHPIRAPRELYLELNEQGISRIVVLDSDGHKQFVTVQEMVQLPSAATSPAP